jgi:glutamine synthetase
MFSGDMYAAKDLPEVPKSLRAATDSFAESKFARKAFGADVVQHYTHFFRDEEAQYEKAVTDWERQRYFERI